MAVCAGRRRSMRSLGGLTLHAELGPVRTADTISVARDPGNGLASRAVVSHSTDEISSGVPACAVCHHPEATPQLAGDRALGPDHLYLICDRCGRRWQRYS